MVGILKPIHMKISYNSIHQGVSVDEYIDAFIELLAQVEGLTDQQSPGFFLSGLREEIRVRIPSHDTTSLSHTMNLAREIELEIHFFRPLSSWNRSSSKDIKWSSGYGLRSVPNFQPKFSTLIPKA